MGRGAVEREKGRKEKKKERKGKEKKIYILEGFIGWVPRSKKSCDIPEKSQDTLVTAEIDICTFGFFSPHTSTSLTVLFLPAGQQPALLQERPVYLSLRSSFLFGEGFSRGQVL